jgi:hypothetical protein
MRNKYCSNCLATQRFLDLGTCLVCERCTKRLERIVPATEHDAPAAERPAEGRDAGSRDARFVVWADRTTFRREAV